MAGPFARILAQVVIVAGGAVVRSIVTAYKEAAARGGSNPAAASVKQAISRRMGAEEAAKILDVELNQATRERMAQRYEALYKANAANQDFQGSPYLQRKVANAHTVLNDYLNKVSKQQ
jgi:hypothetical protein